MDPRKDDSQEYSWFTCPKQRPQTQTQTQNTQQECGKENKEVRPIGVRREGEIPDYMNTLRHRHL